jgi:hypothetical protein
MIQNMVQNKAWQEKKMDGTSEYLNCFLVPFSIFLLINNVLFLSFFLICPSLNAVSALNYASCGFFQR